MPQPAPLDQATPPAAGAAAHWLGIESGGHRLLVPLAQSGEIAPPSPVLALPHVKPWVLGVTTLRGDLFTVVDLVRWLGWPVLAPVAATRFVSFSAQLGVNAVWPVDRLLGLRSADDFVPAPEPLPSPVLRQVLADAQDNVWYELDLMLLCERPDFLDINERPAAAGATQDKAE